MAMNPLELFSVAAKLVLNKTDFDNGINDADKSGKGLAENLSGYMEKAKKVISGLFTVVAIKKAASAVWDLAQSTAAAGDRIDKQSQAIGFSRKAFQEWDYILSQNGMSIDSLGASVRTITKAISENSADTSAALSKLGLSAAHLQSLSPEEQFEAIVKALQGMPEGAEKTTIAMQLLGRNYQSLMPLLNGSSDSMEELRQRAHDLGLVMSDEDVDASVHFTDALDSLNRAWTAIKQKFGGQVLPTLTKGLVAAANAIGRISNALQSAFKTGQWGDVFKIITEEIGNFIPGLIDTIINIASGLFENADKIIDLAVSIVTGLTSGLMKAMPKLVAKLPAILKSVMNGVLNVAKSIGNGVIDLINSIFGTNIPHLDEIKWPSWEDVKTAATNMWNGIKAKLHDLMVYIFGEDENGGIKWPSAEEIWNKIKEGAVKLWEGLQPILHSIFAFVFGEDENGGIIWPSVSDIWETVKKGATTLWDGLTEQLRNLFVFMFGEDENGGINWPKPAEIWEKVKIGATTLWEGIKSLLRSVFVFIFGEDAEGGINWPDVGKIWEKVKVGAGKLWEGIQAGLNTIFKFMFGEDEDGNINWPDASAIWAKIKSGAETLWNGIKGFMHDVFVFIFGEDEHGGIAWPDARTIWNKISSGLATLWASIEGYATDILKFMFGENDDGGIAFPDANTIWNKIQGALSALWKGIKGLAKNILIFMFGEDENGGIAWPSADEAWEKGHALFEKFWKGVQGLATKVMTLIFGAGGSEGGGITWPDATKLWNNVKAGFAKFWGGEDGNGGMAKFLQTAATWVLGLFGFPKETTEEIVEFFSNWWTTIGDAISGAAEWVLNIFGFLKNDEYEASFRKFWEGEDGNGGMKADIKQIASWVLGIFGLPDVDDIAHQMSAWWNGEDGKGGAKDAIVACLDWMLGAFGLPKWQTIVDQVTKWWNEEVLPNLKLMFFATFGGNRENPLGDTDAYNSAAAAGFQGWYFNDLTGDWEEYAKGLNYVPYDGFRAELHRGETILNQAQGREWREGNGNGGVDKETLYRTIADAVGEAIQGIQINMDGTLVGNAVTKQVSKNIYQAQYGRRHAAI